MLHYILTPFAWLMRVLYQVLHNYGFALIAFSLITKLILLPFTAKSKKSMMKTARLGPKTKELQDKYGDDKMKYQQAVSELYKKENVSVTGGCLWSLLPILLMFALYYVIRQPLTYLMQLSADQISQITNLLTGMGIDVDTGNKVYQEIAIARHIHENIDAVRGIVPNILDINFNFFGLDLSQIPQFKFWISGSFWSDTTGMEKWSTIGLFFIPVVSAGMSLVSSLLMQRLNASVATNDKGERDAGAGQAANQSMKMMTYMMPLMSLWIGFIMPASMCIYWIAQSVFTMIQDSLLTVHYRKVYDAEDAAKRERAAQEAALEAEREARRAERRALQPEGGAANPNTSKRKIKNLQKANEPVPIKGKLTEEEREALRQKRQEKKDGDPNRPYSRGRAYCSDRYGDSDASDDTRPDDQETDETDAAQPDTQA